MIPTKEHQNKYYKFLAKIPLFANIDEDELINFFHSVQVKQFYRNEMVTFDAEEHSKCYIVYEGLFKLTKIDEKGEEIVISIADVKDVVSPMYFSPHYDVCAEFVKKTTLLYFNKEVVDSFSTKNNQFSNNIIDLLANSVQKLMLIKEVLQLKSAKEKVGWYLVHSKVNDTFELPYSKSLIAAYLGMKPESFSRALMSLKKDGVHLNNKTVVLENEYELCKYCDKVTGSSCTSFLSNQCIHNQT